MNQDHDTNKLVQLGLAYDSAIELINFIDARKEADAAKTWQLLTKQLKDYPFPIHLFLFTRLFPDWRENPLSAPAWIPTETDLYKTNLSQLMRELSFKNFEQFHTWSHQSYQSFWKTVVDKLKIVFKTPATDICDLSHGIEKTIWFPNAQLNIIDSCFIAPAEKTALIYQDTSHHLVTMSYHELHELTNRVANGLVNAGFKVGDAIGICMPMNHHAVVAYLGIIKMGGVVVSIADSFSSQEIATRLKIANAQAIITQDFSLWNDKNLPLYEKVSAANPNKIIVTSSDRSLSIKIRPQDCLWNELLSENTTFTSVACQPMQHCNILFSSGTTADPKAIPWNHTTPIKVASDAFFHQNIQPDDVLAWPTNLGWMMGPWLIFAGLINQASIALYTQAPKTTAFGQFIQDAKVTMLGVVPTLVGSWRESGCMEKLNWQAIKVFSSTGECSNAEDMLYLMSLANYKPIIEYCGGTEIGGAYVTSTVIQNNYPAIFSTPAMGLDFKILNEEGHLSDMGEVAIIPPSIGLSTELLNANHHQVYFADMPKIGDELTLRRHGDSMKRVNQHFYSILGRVDDAMNLGGIKVSAAEIERAISGSPMITETAAIAIPSPNNGPNQLVIYASTQAELNQTEILQIMQKKINTNLNPLFKIHEVIFVKELPKTASNKIMRRALRKQYQGN